MITRKNIVLFVVFASLVTLALLVKDWKSARVVAIMTGIFLIGRVLRRRF